MAIAAAATILPAYLLDNGLIAPEGRTVHAPSLSRFLILAFEVVAWGTWVRLLRGRSPFLSWFAIDSSDEPAEAVPALASDGACPHRGGAERLPVCGARLRSAGVGGWPPR